MQDVIDFTPYPRTNTFYGGSERKIGILVNGCEYMLKFRKRDSLNRLRDNHTSEYIGSHIFDLLGFPVQETYLGLYRGEPVVACKNFLHKGEEFVPFNEVGESTLERDKETYQYSYQDIMQMLHDNSKLTDVQETVQAFWEMYVVDALLGNFDRHGANWGFIRERGTYRMAPVFDNGSCLFPRLTDEGEMRAVMSSREETERRILEFPTSQIKLEGKKSSYYDVIHSLSFPECNEALRAVCERCDLRLLERFLDSAPMLDEGRRAFLKHMLRARYERILRESYELLMGRRVR